MAKTLRFRFHRRNMFAPVQHCVTGCGALTGDGVDAWLWSKGGVHVALIADHPHNKGVSATNGFREYALAVARAAETLGAPCSDIRWFEFDSTGAFDLVTLNNNEESFAPVAVSPHKPRSKEAFLAMVTALAPESFSFWESLVDELVSTSIQA